MLVRDASGQVRQLCQVRSFWDWPRLRGGPLKFLQNRFGSCPQGAYSLRKRKATCWLHCKGKVLRASAKAWWLRGRGGSQWEDLGKCSGQGGIQLYLPEIKFELVKVNLEWGGLPEYSSMAKALSESGREVSLKGQMVPTWKMNFCSFGGSCMYCSIPLLLSSVWGERMQALSN